PVMRRRGVSNRSLYRTTIPGIVTRARASPRGMDHRCEEDGYADTEDDRADGRDQVGGGPTHVAVVRERAPRHAGQPEEMHREERQVEPDHDEPDAHLGPPVG